MAFRPVGSGSPTPLDTPSVAETPTPARAESPDGELTAVEENRGARRFDGATDAAGRNMLATGIGPEGRGRSLLGRRVPSDLDRPSDAEVALGRCPPDTMLEGGTEVALGRCPPDTMLEGGTEVAL
ncbi:MAG: hypothetical protein AAF654_15135, partial [Myxococcota bacterium]